MKDKLRVWFEYWSPDMPIRDDNFLLQALKAKYDVELSFPADVVFFSNYSPPPYRGVLGRIYRMYIRLFGKNRFGVPRIDWLAGTHKSIFVCEENVRPVLDYADLSLGFDHEEDWEDSRYIRFPFYAMVHQETFQNLVGSARENFIQSRKVTKFCEYVYSKSVPQREAFFDALSSYKQIGSPGKSRNNMAPIGSGSVALESRLAENWMSQKIAFSQNYKFSIAMENVSYPGYITEKIVNAYASGCIPIYWGDPAVTKDFNPESFINLHDYSSYAAAVEAIKEIDNDEHKYKQMLNSPVFIDDRVPYHLTKEYILEKISQTLESTS